MQDAPQESRDPSPEPEEVVAGAAPPSPPPPPLPAADPHPPFDDPLSASAAAADDPLSASALLALPPRPGSPPPASSPPRPAYATRPPVATTTTLPLPRGDAPATQPPAVIARVAVSDPQTLAEPPRFPGVGGTYVSYLVTTTHGEGFGLAPGATARVRRRFRDVVALADALKARHRGYILPPRPDRVYLGGGGGAAVVPPPPRAPSAAVVDPAVEARGLAIAAWLNALASHPAAGASAELAAWLTADGPLASSGAWLAVQPLARASLLDAAASLPRALLGGDRRPLTPADVGRSAGAAGDVGRGLAELGTALRRELGDAPPDLPPGEAALRAAKADADAVAAAVATAARAAEACVGAADGAGAALGDVGLALLKLARFDDDASSRAGPFTAAGAAMARAAGDARRAGAAAVRMSRIARVATGEQARALTPLHATLAIAPAIGKALREREGALLTWQSVDGQLATARRAAAAGGEGGRRAADDVAALELASTAAAAEYRKVAARNEAELARVDRARRAALGGMLHALAGVGVAANDRYEGAWREVAAQAAAGGEGGGGRE